ncbi:MFS transporter [Dongia soli]|uniref:MFS transporter n=1 Tax=Dongia soli TaxID=600628 RepID=A0ABU5E6L0_9PROT|nr:MFS transporter [Dongia soli]MDY0881937.1 MFS transporter [Dongia soli]
MPLHSRYSTPRPTATASLVPAHQLGEDRRRTDWGQVVFGLSLSCFVAFQQFKLPPLLPRLLAEFNYSPTMAGSFMSIYALVGLVASMPMGRWLRRHGYRPGLMIGLAAAALGLLLALGFAHFAGAMLLARGLEGLTYAIFAIAGPVIATEAAKIRDLPLVTGLLAGWIPIGQIAAGLLALAWPDWRTIWLLALALTLALTVPSWRYRNHRPVNRSADGATKPQPGAKAANLSAAAIFLLWSGQYFAFMTWLTQFLIERHHLDPHRAVVIYLIPVVVLLAFNVITGWALGRGLRVAPALLICLLLQAGVWASISVLDGLPGLIALIVYGICAGVTPTCLFHLPHLIAASEGAATRAGPEAFGTLMAGRNIGVFVGPLVLPQMLAYFGDWDLAADFIAVATLLAGAIVLLLGRHLRRPQQH